MAPTLRIVPATETAWSSTAGRGSRPPIPRQSRAKAFPSRPIWRRWSTPRSESAKARPSGACPHGRLWRGQATHSLGHTRRIRAQSSAVISQPFRPSKTSRRALMNAGWAC